MSRKKPRIACFGGVYSNYLALEAALADVRRRGADAVYCLGDLGAFGPHPDRIFAILADHNVHCLRGNYDDSVGHALDDCQCGYTDPRDNHFAQISYDYTLRNTSESNRRFLRELPGEIRFELGSHRVLLCHGSPRRTNEFLWESTTPTHFLEKLCNDHDADCVLGTHTGIKWQRRLGGRSLGGESLGRPRRFVNVGVLGRPENDGHTHVWYTMLETDGGDADAGDISVEFVPVQYDHRRLAGEMADEGLPEEFQETILAGSWTTCLEILPAKERKRGKY